MTALAPPPRPNGRVEEKDLRASLRAVVEQSVRLQAASAALKEKAVLQVEVSRWIADDVAARRTQRPAAIRLMPVCSYCGRLANACRAWAHVPEHLRPGGTLTHSICRECWGRLPEMDDLPYPED